MPNLTPFQLYLRNIDKDDDLKTDEEILFEAEEEDPEYVPEAQAPTPEHNTWQDQLSAWVTTLESTIHELRNDFHAYEHCSLGDMYDIQTQLAAMHMAQ